MLALCVLAVLTALAGLVVVGLALGPLAGVAGAILAAPALGVASLGSGTAAAVIALRRAG